MPEKSRGPLVGVENAENDADSRRGSGIGVLRSWCQACQKIPLAQIFRPTRTSRQKRFAISHPYKPDCPLCRFLTQLEQLDLGQSEDRLSDVSIDTGKPALFLSTFDTHEPWWHILGLTTRRPMPHFAWFQREGSASASRSARPVVLVTCTSPPTDPVLVDLSVPRRRPKLEQDQGLIDMDIVKDWIQICEEKHGPSCRVDLDHAKKPESLLLIDVNTRRIVETDSDARYVALSYVWGNRNKTSYGALPESPSTSDLSGLAQLSVMKRLPQKLPATFEDAVTVVQALEEKYLWIDLFCIDQTNPHELQSQINQMNRIYQTATFTIVARDTPDAYYGLPGVSRPLRKRSQPTCFAPQGELMGTFFRPAIVHSGQSPWDRRGWTLQESLFSHRRLSFSHNTVRMLCQKEYFHDSLVNTLTQYNPTTLANRFDWLDDDNSIDLHLRDWDFKTYNALVSIYTNRILRYPSDILNACRGALVEVDSRTDVQFIYGIPVSDAHRALLWSPHFTHTLSRRCGGWPSWSWCGWMGRIEWRRWIVDLSENEIQADADDRHLSILNRQANKRQRIGDRSTSRYTRGHEDHTANGNERRMRAQPAVLRFPSSESSETTPILGISSLIAPCALIKAPTDAREPTLLTYADDDIGTATKKDLGYHWTLLNPVITSSQGHPTPLTDIVNSTGEPEVFAESDHFLRLSKRESEMLEALGTVEVGNGRARQKKQQLQVPAELVLIKHWDLIRDSEDHDGWLADMVGCLVVVPVGGTEESFDGGNGSGENGENEDEEDGKRRVWRAGMVLLERETFEAFGPKLGQRDLV